MMASSLVLPRRGTIVWVASRQPPPWTYRKVRLRGVPAGHPNGDRPVVRSTSWTIRREVRAFVVSRRAKITPDQTGLPAGTNRRVPGLRRSEVAALAGVSVEYYSRLERGALAGHPRRDRSGTAARRRRARTSLPLGPRRRRIQRAHASRAPLLEAMDDPPEPAVGPCPSLPQACRLRSLGVARRGRQEGPSVPLHSARGNFIISRPSGARLAQVGAPAERPFKGEAETELNRRTQRR
jgi:hypothetical protein